MNKPNDVTGCFDASNCSTAIKVLELLRNGLEKSETTARARAANMEGWIRSQWIVKANTLREVIDLVDNMIETIPTENPYANCKSFDEVCKVFIEEDHEMRKFFGKDKQQSKKWTLKRNVFVRVLSDWLSTRSRMKTGTRLCQKQSTRCGGFGVANRGRNKSRCRRSGR